MEKLIKKRIQMNADDSKHSFVSKQEKKEEERLIHTWEHSDIYV